ncbi:MAG: cytochrome P450 [Acidimicrobiales bacterium]
MPVSDGAISEFDHHSEEFFDHRHEEWMRQRRCPVAHNSHYGGFWVVSGYDEVAAVSRDGATFSSKYVEDSPDGIEYLGIMGIPRMPGVPPALIAEVEGPTHAALRRLLNPFMLPSAVAGYQPFIEQCATWFLDQRIGEGRMDAVKDFANPVPAILTMKMVGLPCESWSYYAEIFHSMNAHGAASEQAAHARSLVGAMIAELLRVAAERRVDPKEDILSRLVALEIEDGRGLRDDELIGVLWNLIGGGLDTTTSLTSLTLHHLDLRPELRQKLIDDPDLLVPAIEEFLRFTSVNETLTRTVTADVELGGQQLKRGDFVMLSWLSANFDEKMFDRPEEVVLDRSPNPHLAFGVGPHRCIGMHIARAMFVAMMREVLTRIPDYRVDREATSFYRGNPELAGVVTMPIDFTPGPTVGVERPF